MASTALYTIVAKWQKLGFLVAKDTTKPGLWLFENGSATETTSLPSGTTLSPGRVSVEGVDLLLKQSGSYDFNTLLESWKSLLKPVVENGELLSPKELFEKHFRAAQASVQNKQAITNNALIGAGGEAGLPALEQMDKIQPSIQRLLYRHVHECFLTAVLSSLSYALCHDSGYVALGPRTLVAPRKDGVPIGAHVVEEEDGELIEDQIQLVTLSCCYTAGRVLVIKASLSRSRSYTYCHPPQHAKPEILPIPTESILLLGPGGVMGKYIGLASQESPLAPRRKISNADEPQGAEDQKHPTGFQRWKTRCSQWLASKGLKQESLETGAWLLVEVYLSQLMIGSHLSKDALIDLSAEEPTVIPWPSSLCFRQADATSGGDTAFGTLTTYDPLEFAQAWYTTRDDRDATITRRKKENEAAEVALKAQADSESHDLHSMYSPLALRRSSMAGLVYPTPPDGVLHTVGATPSFDGNVSTPGQPSQPLLPDVNPAFAARAETEANGSMDMRTNQNSALDFQDTSNDNLFGDMGEDLFGEENDITDADFSFFDEPGAFQGKQDVNSFDEIEQENAVETLDDNILFGPKDASNMHDEIEHDKMEHGKMNHDKMEGADVQMGGTDETLNGENVPLEIPSDSRPLAQVEGKLVIFTDQKVRPQKPSPTLKPESIFRRLSTCDVFSHPLRREEDEDTSKLMQNPTGAFDGVDFNPSFRSLYEKYGSHGHFIYPSQKSSPSISRTRLPTTDYFTRRRQHKLSGQDSIAQSLSFGTEQRRLESRLETTNDEPPIQHSHRTPSSSGQDDSSDSLEDNSAHITTGNKRKREIEDGGESIGEEEFSSSFQDLKVCKDNQTENKILESFDPSALDADPAGWSLAPFLEWPDSRSNAPILTDTEYIAAAQILGDQAISRTVRCSGDEDDDQHEVSLKTNVEMTYTPELIHQDVLQAAKKFFKDVDTCTVSKFLEIQGMPRASLNRPPPRTSQNPQGTQGLNPAKPSPIIQLPSPYLEVRRSDTKLSVLASALPFWDVLGLAPRSSGKHVTSLCIYPDAVGMAENSDAFLENIRSAYETRRLGNHERLNLESCSNGLLPVELGGQTARFASDQGLSIVREVLFQAASTLASLTVENTNFVVYAVYDSENPDILVPICSAFHSMFEVYKTAMAGKTVSNELVLQLVPLDFIAARTHLVVPPPTEYARLAMEVYDRCFDFQSGAASPSIVIEPPPPRTIEFKLAPIPSASPLHENSCLHIAYAQSIDDRWITTAWSDNSGSEQMTASYCLGRKCGTLTRQFSDIAHEIWETTLDIISSKKVQWRIIIAKCGVIEPQDVQFWRDLAGTETNAKISLSILTVATQPSLQLLAPGFSIPAATLTTQAAFYTTPVSTPQPSSILSPDHSGNALTPVREGSSSTPNDGIAELKIEPDATLVDLYDQTYSAMLSHRTNNTNSPLDVRPSIISGYLIKRTGASASDVPAVLEVNIIWTDINSRPVDIFLRDILAWYRGLATLARARGIVHPTKDTRPWHVAAAEKAVRMLYLLM